MQVFVDNLPAGVDEQEVAEAFSRQVSPGNFLVRKIFKCVFRHFYGYIENSFQEYNGGAYNQCSADFRAFPRDEVRYWSFVIYSKMNASLSVRLYELSCTPGFVGFVELVGEKFFFLMEQKLKFGSDHVSGDGASAFCHPVETHGHLCCYWCNRACTRALENRGDGKEVGDSGKRVLKTVQERHQTWESSLHL